jgi:S-adenosylmethionine decarboxylase
MFSKNKYSGKHLILDIKNIRNKSIINDLDELKSIMDTICTSNDFQVLQRIEEKFNPHGLSIIYLLSESHMSIHTFPEKNYIAFDLYTCREYEHSEEYHKIHRYILRKTDADYEEPIIINRRF